MAAITKEQLDSMFPLPPASTMIIEMYEAEDSEGFVDKFVRAYLNDQYVPLLDCVSNPCKVADFMVALELDLSRIEDIESFCYNIPPQEKSVNK